MSRRHSLAPHPHAQDIIASQVSSDVLPETHETEWYKRLIEATELATQAELVQAGVVTRQ